VLSFLTPCVLPMVPIYLANLGGAVSMSAEANRWVILLNALLFVAGFTVVFIIVGASLGLLGAVLPADTLRIVGGIVLIVLGVFLLVSTKVPWLNYEMRLSRDVER